MAVYDKVVVKGTIGAEERVAVPSYPGERNPGEIHFSGSWVVVERDGGLRYNFGISSGATNRLSVNRPLAEAYAQAGSRTARAALDAAAGLKP